MTKRISYRGIKNKLKYPKKANKSNNKVNSQLKSDIRSKNPDINEFSLNSTFIFEPRYSKYFFDKLSDKNLMKPNDDDILFFRNNITQYNLNENQSNFYVLPFFNMLMNNVYKVKPSLDYNAKIIDNIMKSKVGKETNLSLSKITEEYKRIANVKNIKPLQKSSVHKILRNILGYKYRKTTVKTSKLIANESIKFTIFFLKIILRCIKIGLTLIYIDESGFFTKNDNYRTWRKDNQCIYYKINDNKKINLIMAVGQNKIYHYKLNTKNTNSIEFKNFMEELVFKFKKDEIKNYVFVLDNLSAHLTDEMFDFYKKNKMKILFTVPYRSTFNMIENVFREIKNITYKKLYSNTFELKKDLKSIIEGEKIKKYLPKLFNETMKEYESFIDSYINNNNINNL